MNVSAAWHWEWCRWCGHLAGQCNIHAPVIKRRHATPAMWQLRLFLLLQPLRCSAARNIASPHEGVKALFLPFPGLSSAFSGRCWPLSLQSAPSPNSTQPFCYVSIFGCRTEGNKSRNSPFDRYWREIINVLGWNNPSTVNEACVAWKMYLWKDVSARRKLSSTITELLFAHPWQKRRMRTETLLKAQMLLRTHTVTLIADLWVVLTPQLDEKRIIRVRLEHCLDPLISEIF